MKTQLKDIYWLAGLIEGDGCFTSSASGEGCPTIAVKMSDRDVVVRANNILRPGGECPVRMFPDARSDRQPIFISKLTGARAIGWMMTLYPLMGERRQARIRELIAAWKTTPKSQRPQNKSLVRAKLIA